MPTRRERLVESLKKEDRRADLKRLKKAKEYLGLAIAVLENPMHDQDFEGQVDVVRPEIAEQCDFINKVILEG